MLSLHHHHLFLMAAVVLSTNGHMIQDQLAFPLSDPIRLHPSRVPSPIPILRSVTFTTAPQQVSITDLLTNTQDYHQHLVSVQGLITQPELHLDETELYIDFVFRLVHGEDSIVVYGRHDRTQGAPPIMINRFVEVIGTFWKEQERKGVTIFNAIEAFSVTPSPPSTPWST